MSGPFKMKGSSFYGHGNASPAKQESKKEGDVSVEDQIAQAEAQFGEGFEVKMSEHQTPRDNLAKKIGIGKSGIIKEGMEQSAKSSNYKRADEILSESKNKNTASNAKQRLANRAKRTANAKEAFKNNPNMTQAEVDKLMSEG
jgi:hypothetical protein